MFDMDLHADMPRINRLFVILSGIYTCNYISIVQSLPDNSIHSAPGHAALFSQAPFAAKYHLVAVIFLACLPSKQVSKWAHIKTNT